MNNKSTQNNDYSCKVTNNIKELKQRASVFDIHCHTSRRLFSFQLFFIPSNFLSKLFDDPCLTLVNLKVAFYLLSLTVFQFVLIFTLGSSGARINLHNPDKSSLLAFTFNLINAWESVELQARILFYYHWIRKSAWLKHENLR